MSDTINKDYVNSIQEKLNLDDAQFANLLEISTGSLYNIRHSSKNYTAKHVLILAKATGEPVTSFLLLDK